VRTAQTTTVASLVLNLAARCAPWPVPPIPTSLIAQAINEHFVSCGLVHPVRYLGLKPEDS
jgi:hypothetical protein